MILIIAHSVDSYFHYSLGQEELGDGPSDLEIEIFEICDSDNNGALTWPEVMDCEVSKN